DDRAGPPEDCRRPHAALPGGSLAFAQWTRGAAVCAKRQPRTVVAREHDQRVAIEACGFQRVENPTRAGVELFDDVAVDAFRAVSLELRRAGERNVRERMREVEEERSVLVRFDEPDGFIGVAVRQ